MILVLIAFSSKEGPDEPAQMRRLARAFVARIYKVGMQIKILFKSWTSSIT